LTVNKFTGRNIAIRLKDVILNNSEINGPAIYQTQNETYDESDYACIDNVTKNTTGVWFKDYNADDASVAWAYLLSNCPD